MVDTMTIDTRRDTSSVPLTTDEKIDALYREVQELKAALLPTLEKLSSGGIMALLGMGKR